jgi:hypothetical protein
MADRQRLAEIAAGAAIRWSTRSTACPTRPAARSIEDWLALNAEHNRRGSRRRQAAA